MIRTLLAMIEKGILLCEKEAGLEEPKIMEILPETEAGGIDENALYVAMAGGGALRVKVEEIMPASQNVLEVFRAWENLKTIALSSSDEYAEDIQILEAFMLAPLLMLMKREEATTKKAHANAQTTMEHYMPKGWDVAETSVEEDEWIPQDGDRVVFEGFTTQYGNIVALSEDKSFASVNFDNSGVLGIETSKLKRVPGEVQG